MPEAVESRGVHVPEPVTVKANRDQVKLLLVIARVSGQGVQDPGGRAPAGWPATGERPGETCSRPARPRARRRGFVVVPAMDSCPAELASACRVQSETVSSGIRALPATKETRIQPSESP